MKFPIMYEVKAPFPPLRAFLIPCKKAKLQVVAGIEPDGWEHVSVSLSSRNPSWDEMCFIKNLFFDGEELCLQFHPKRSQYVNVHNYCLHIWKPPAHVAQALERELN